MRFWYILICCLLLSISCKKISKPTFYEIEIDNGWICKSLLDTAWVSAQIPGNTLSDLMYNGIADSVYNPANRDKINDFFKNEWVYTTSFDVPQEILSQNNILIRLEGVAGNADVIINGINCTRINNMFIAYNIPCKGLLKEYQNKLEVKFNSGFNPKTKLSSRKAAYLNGSEINPTIPFQGIWKPVKLIAWTGTIIRNVYFETLEIQEIQAQIEVSLDIEADKEGKFYTEFEINKQLQKEKFNVQLKKGFQTVKFKLSISNPQLWWCNGMGKQPIYEAKINLWDENRIVSEKNSRFGIRKIEKIEQTDSIGYNFFFKLNNKPVFIKGGVFTPLDMFDFTNSTARYEQVISNAANANMNLLRVWGGGFYESDDFYDLCDKYGIMVWQDLAFSCNLTLANDLKQYNLNEEISENITRIRSHPSLIMLFCNSDLSSYSDFKANKIFPKLDTIKSDCQSFYSDDLPFIIAERCKIPFYSACSMNNRVKNGLIRDWRVWYDAAPVSVYNENQGGLFIEYGMQSLVDKSTIPLEDEQFTFIPSAADNYQFCKMPWLGNGVNGNKLITDYIQMYYNDPLDYSSTIYLSQLFQANSLKIAIESHRLHKPFCMGTIFWHFNDCWPAITWSVTDYFNNNKPSYYAIKNAFKNIKVIPEKLYGDIRVWAINDSLGTFDGECNITLMDFYGKKLYSKKIKTLIPADQTQILWLINEENLVKSKWTNKVFLYVELMKNGKLADENFLFFSDPRFLDLPVPDISYNVVEDENMNNHIEISSNCFAKNVMLYSDSLIVRFSDNNLEMIPGRTYSISTDFLGRKDELQDKLRIISLIDSY